MQDEFERRVGEFLLKELTLIVKDYLSLCFCLCHNSLLHSGPCAKTFILCRGCDMTKCQDCVITCHCGKTCCELCLESQLWSECECCVQMICIECQDARCASCHEHTCALEQCECGRVYCEECQDFCRKCGRSICCECSVDFTCLTCRVPNRKQKI